MDELGTEKARPGAAPAGLEQAASELHGIPMSDQERLNEPRGRTGSPLHHARLRDGSVHTLWTQWHLLKPADVSLDA